MGRQLKKYRIVIEAAFVDVAGSEAREQHGFFTTFNTSAINAKNAMHHVGIQLAQRMNKNHVLERREGVLKTRYLVHDIWEVEADAGNKGGGGN